MNKIDRNQELEQSHAEIAELIPWYAKGTLSDDERARVSAHLETCEHCRQTLTECQAIAQTATTVQAEWQPSPAHFNRVLAALDELEANEKRSTVALSDENQVKAPSKPGFFRRLGTAFLQTPTSVRWALAAETLAIAGLIGFLVLPSQMGLLNSSGFETLSDVESTDRKAANVARVVFAGEMSVKDLSELLKATKAQIRQGPSAIGAFTVEVAKDNVPQAIAAFRANKNVRLVLLMDQSSGQ